MTKDASGRACKVREETRVREFPSRAPRRIAADIPVMFPFCSDRDKSRVIISLCRETAKDERTRSETTAD